MVYAPTKLRQAERSEATMVIFPNHIKSPRLHFKLRQAERSGALCCFFRSQKGSANQTLSGGAKLKPNFVRRSEAELLCCSFQLQKSRQKSPYITP